MPRNTETDCAQWMSEIETILQSPGFGFSKDEAAGLMEVGGMTILQAAWVRGASPEEAARLLIA